ncbi:MAG: FGGY-family carbohydrate kinase, partial [Planctomycetota bacterium]
VYESPEITGELHSEAARAMGLNEGTPVVAGSGDVMTGAVGNGITEAGLINANLGTGGVMCAHSDNAAIDNKGRLATMCHAVPGAYVVFGCMLSAAGSLQWYADRLGEKTVGKKGDLFGKLIKLAEAAPVGSGGTIFLPYLTGERCPHNDPDARGGWVGVTRRTEEAHLVRSLLEGVTFNMNAMLQIMQSDMDIPVKQIRGTGGGTKSQLWRQMQADIYKTPLTMMSSEEGAAYGAALLAGVGNGTFKSVEAACKSKIKTASTTKPKAKDADLYAKYYDVYSKLYDDLKDRYTELAALDG